MKKVVMVGILGALLGLGGCAEKNSGLDKQLINTMYDKCNSVLTSSLKSPSSLKIIDSSVVISSANSNDVFNAFGDELFDKKGKVTKDIINDKSRFRQLLMLINYDADNSYGASLRDVFECKYIFKLDGDNKSPSAKNTYLYSINDDENIEKLVDLKGSKFSIDGNISKVTVTVSSIFSDDDKGFYSNLEDQYLYATQDKEAKKMMEDWRKASLNEAP